MVNFNELRIADDRKCLIIDFEVERVDFEGECGVRADPMYLKRVIDNFVSNIKKYADRSRPVLLLSEHSGGTLRVRFSNAVAHGLSRVESTKIGIRTCEKIMTHMGGQFAIHNDGARFEAELSLPAQKT